MRTIRQFSSSNTREIEQNYSPYYLVWLDATCHSQNILPIRRELRFFTNYFQVFDRIDHFQGFLQSCSSNSRIIFIVSGDFCREIIPELDRCPKIISMYIFCVDNAAHQPWSEQYNKVKGVHSQWNEIIEQMKCDQSRERIRDMRSDEAGSLLFSTTSESTTGLDGRFVQSQLLISCLLQMKTIEPARQEFISHFRNFYRENAKYTKEIDEFEKHYSSLDPVRWYTRDSFFYRKLNQALRDQDIDLLFLFQFFIHDMQKQLERDSRSESSNNDVQKQSKRDLRSESFDFYRGQLITKDEFEVLRNSIGRLISFNSFTSASREINTAFMYAGADRIDEDSLFEHVVFEINTDDPDNLPVKRFADISQISQYPNEKEILITLGTIFRVRHILRHNRRKVWYITLDLCSDHDRDVKSVVSYMENQYNSMSNRLLHFAYVLIDMSHFKEAEKYLLRMLNEFPSDHLDVVRCHQALGKVYCEEGNYQSAHDHLNKALDSLDQSEGNNGLKAYIYNSIGEIYQNQANWTQALESYKKALELFQENSRKNDESIAWGYNNLGIIYEKQNDFENAAHCYTKAFEIKRKILPRGHACLGNSYMNMGNMYYHRNDYDQALKNYMSCYEIFVKSLKYRHPSLARILRNIGLTHEAQSNFEQAMLNFDKSYDIRKAILSTSHPDLIEIKADIARIIPKIVSNR